MITADGEAFDEWIGMDSTLTFQEWVDAGCPKVIRGKTFVCENRFEIPHDGNWLVENCTFYGVRIR